MNTPKYIVIHSTDVSWTKNRDQFLAVDNYHKGKDYPKSSLGYYVGYHRLITGGKNYPAKEDVEVGAHTNQVENGRSINLQSLGICVGFDGDVEYPHPDDYKLLQEQIWSWQEKYNISDEKVVFHRHFNTAKTCPGMLLGPEWKEELLATVAKAKPEDQEEKQREILTQKISLLQQLIKLWQEVKSFPHSAPR